MSGRRRYAEPFARAPRRHVPRPPSDAGLTLAAVVADPRWRTLPSRAQRALTTAVLLYADAEGKWWPKLATWAAETGLSVATLERAICDLEDVGYLEREHYLRPDGRQGSTTYRLDPELVRPAPMRLPGLEEAGEGQAASRVRELVDLAGLEGGAEATSCLTGEGATSCLTGEAPEQVFEQETRTGQAAALEARPDRTASPPAEEDQEPEVAAIAAHLLAASPPETDALTRHQLEDLGAVWATHPRALQASAWDCATSSAIRRPLACLVARVAAGLLEPSAWTRVVARWEAAGRPRPWAERAEPAPAHPGQLELGQARLRDAAAPDPFASLPAERTPGARPGVVAATVDALVAEVDAQATGTPPGNARLRELLAGRLEASA